MQNFVFNQPINLSCAEQDRIESTSRVSRGNPRPLTYLYRTLILLFSLFSLSIGQMWGAYYITGSNGNLSGWGTWKAMTESSDGMFWYFQLASGDCNCKINTKQGYDNPTALGEGARSAGFCDTDLGENTWENEGNINYWYNSGSYYILVYVPNTTVNSANSAKVCASTFLPDAGYETTGNTMKYYSNKAGTDQTTSALDRDNGSSTDLGTVTTLYLKGFNSKMWQHGSGNIYGESNQHYYYKVHRTAVAAGSTGFTDAKNATSWSAGTWTWGSFNGSKYRYPTYSGSLNENLLSGLGSGNYTMSYYYLQEGSKNFRHPSDGTKFNKLTWTIAVPAMGTHTCTSDGSGDGSSGTPFSVAVGEDLTITVSGTQASSDANSSLYVSFDGGDTYSSTNTYVVENITSSKLSLSIKAKYYNSADDLSGTVYDFGTIYYQGTLTPSLAISSFTQNASTVTAANSGSTVTINASRQNAGSATITYAYSTDNSNWTTIASTTSTSQSWTLPAVTSTTTYYVKASMTYDATGYSDTETFTVYGKKTIKVKDTNNWGANFKIHRWGGDASGTEYPGETTNITSAGGQWKQVVLYSSSTDFIFCNGSSTSTADANKTADKTYAGMTDGYCYVIQSGSGASLTLTSTDCPEAPSVTTAAATSVGTTSVQFNASGVDANNDAITAYGFKWGTTSACSSGTVTASNLGAGTTFSASKTGLTNGNTYYFKAYATNGQGTTYGEAVSVRTMFVTTVTLNPQGGSGGTTSVDATEGSAMPGSKTAPGKTGYTFGGYYANSGGSGTKYYNANMTSAHNWDVAASTAEIHAKWTPITYTIHFNGNGNTSGSMSNQTGVTYDAATTITANAFGRTGYNFAGWATTQERANEGTVDRTNGAAHGNLASSQGATAQLWAVWTPKTCTVTFDYQLSAEGHGNAGTLSNVTATYDAEMPALTGNMPTAANGYAFMGFYSGTGGTGTKYYNPNKSSATNWAENTTETTTLYAYYKKAEITGITFTDGAIVAPNTSKTVTATVSPEPTGTTTVCWRILHNNDNPLDPQPTFSPANAQGRSVSFTSPASSGTYKVEAVLHTGSGCGGTDLSTYVASFQVAGNHNVTVEYKCGDQVIKASASVTGRPLDWTEITAPEIVGYAFSKWKQGDGITIDGADGNGEKDAATIQFKAIYDGKLTAVYTKKRMIYFYNTLGWGSVYVYFYKNDSYWQTVSPYNGSGANTSYTWTNTPYSEGKHGQMLPISEGSNIYYFDAEAEGVNALYDDVVFTEHDQHGYNYFYQTNAVRRGDYKSSMPMFVPLADQTADVHNETNYYNNGYWMNYPENTGYTLKIYDSWNATKETAAVREFTFPYSEDLKMPLKMDVEFNDASNHEYWFMVYRNDGTYLGNTYTFKQGYNAEQVITGGNDKSKLVTSAPGNYTFILTYHDNGSGTVNYYIDLDFPIANGDYRIYYSDNATWSQGTHTKDSWNHPSHSIAKATDAKKDTISFFVSKGDGITHTMKFQKASVTNEGVVTWADVTGGSITIPSSVTTSGVYNFIVSQPEGGASISLEKVEPYTGNYYIRTDCAGNTKWDSFKNADHLMNYSEYSITHGGYSHYYTHWVQIDDKPNVKFVIANDYSQCISDTLTRETASGTWANIGTFIDAGGNLIYRNANVRFMWNQSTNTVSRAYVDGAQEDGSRFLVLSSTDGKIKTAGGSALTNNEVTFSDNENWIYEANVKAQANAAIKLISTWGEGTTILQYFKGSSSETEPLISGDSEDTKWYDIRLIYDFKTNRLVAAMMPSGNIEDPTPIYADVMFIREHQGDVSQLTFTDDGAITHIETAYGVLRFNKYTLNNKDKSTHSVLGDPKSTHERGMFFISFPFRVKLSEVFGFGKYGTHWIIEYYDGAERAANGFWAESQGFWKFVWDRKNFYLEPNQGYLLALDLDELGESSSIWNNNVENVELFFPSYGKMPDISASTATYNIPAHTCTINWAETKGLPDTGDPRTSYNRTVFDSHWNVMSVPTYVNSVASSFGNSAWITTTNPQTTVGPKFLYTWNMDDNTLTATAGASYTYKAMHAYMVQYSGNVTWNTSTSAPVSPIVARRTYSETPKNVDFRLEIQQDEKMIDQTFVELSNDEEVSAGFAFNEDMTKEFNSRKANIYTINDNLTLAGNTLPMSDQTTIVPVGITISTAGDYTFAIPDGTEGIGVTLIDNENGIRTSLSALDYTINLEAGDYKERFLLEISPIKNTPTDIDNVVDEGLQSSGARKVLIDNMLYIVKDGKMFDARGARVE